MNLPNRANYLQPPGPRPKVKATILIDGVPVRVCESVEEMNIRLGHLRKRGDRRSADRIWAAQDDTWARARKGFRRIGGGGEE